MGKKIRRSSRKKQTPKRKHSFSSKVKLLVVLYKKTSLSFRLLFLLFILICAALGVCAYILIQHSSQQALPTYVYPTSYKYYVPTPTPSIAPPFHPVVFTIPQDNSVHKIPVDLGIIRDNGFSQIDEGNITYFTAGTIPEGQYKGYTRILAFFNTGSNQQQLIFATKDEKTYIENGDPTNLQFPPTAPESPYYAVNPHAISAVANLQQINPPDIPLPSYFAIDGGDINTQENSLGRTDTIGNQAYQSSPQTSTSQYSQLSSFSSPLHFYAAPSGGYPTDPNISDEDNSIAQTYLNGTNSIIAVDSTGVQYTYRLTTPVQINEYQASQAIYNKLNLAQEKSKAVGDFKAFDAYVSGEHHGPPILAFTSEDFQTNQPIYSSYGPAFQGHCSTTGETEILKNVSDSDFIQIGTVNSIPVYRLANANHPLYKLMYDFKIDPVAPYAVYFQNTPTPAQKPTFAQYVSRNPLLFLKDPWGRWTVIAELDYDSGGGCGKPVMYLYPPKPTKVTVKFLNRPEFATSIPTYAYSWEVLAQPNGQLQDLQPQYTYCNKINYHAFGSEYAKSACAKGMYPYLYWSGNIIGKVAYTPLTQGWITTKGQLASTLKSRLKDMGLTTKEQQDMLSYWVPTMLKKNSPYYRVSFFQTNQVNTMFPVVVTPQPDSVFRIFLDWQPLSHSLSIKPQVLQKVTRKGFTFVEWGGLDQ